MPFDSFLIKKGKKSNPGKENSKTKAFFFFFFKINVWKNVQRDGSQIVLLSIDYQHHIGTY